MGLSTTKKRDKNCCCYEKPNSPISAHTLLQHKSMKNMCTPKARGPTYCMGHPISRRPARMWAGGSTTATLARSRRSTTAASGPPPGGRNTASPGHTHRPDPTGECRRGGGRARTGVDNAQYLNAHSTGVLYLANYKPLQLPALHTHMSTTTPDHHIPSYLNMNPYIYPHRPAPMSTHAALIT